MPRGQRVMAGIKNIAEHAEQIEIEEERLMTEEERFVEEHLFTGKQELIELGEQLLLLTTPLIDAASAEFPLFMTEDKHAIGDGDHFLPIDIVQLESNSLDIIFEVTPNQGLNSLPFSGEESEAEFGIEIFGDDLGIIAGFEYDRFAILKQRHLVKALAAEFPDEGTIPVQNIRDFEFSAGKLKNPALHDAVRTPGNLNQFDHIGFLRRINRMGKHAQGVSVI